MSHRHSEIHTMFLAAYLGGLAYLAIMVLLSVGVRIARACGVTLELPT